MVPKKSFKYSLRVIDPPDRSGAASSGVNSIGFTRKSPAKLGTCTPITPIRAYTDKGQAITYRASITFVTMAIDSSMDGALDQITNESRSPPPSPPSATAKTGPVLRHKATHYGLNPNLDSSESYPSPHSSIYEASLIHEASLERLKTNDVEDHVPPPTTDNGLPSWDNLVSDASGNPVPVSFLQAPANKNAHIPHELYPITEKSSLATLQAPLSLKCQGSVSTLRPRSPGLNGMKRKSFSLSDLPPTPERRTSPPVSPLASPVQPRKRPPERVPTPPGLPTFGQPEAVSYRLSPPKSRFRDNFRTPTEQREYIRQTVGLPKGVVMRGENGVLVRGKFTPIVSGHLPPQRQVHAVFRAPNQAHSAVPEPLAAARVGNSLSNHVNENVAPHGNGGRQHGEPQKKKDDWKKKACVFMLCCGLCSCLCADSEAETPARAADTRAGIRWDLQPPSKRARYEHSFQGRGRVLN